MIVRSSVARAVRSLALVLLCVLPGGLAEARSGETEVSAQGESGTLRGTFEVPESGATSLAALILPGSGPTDRNGNNALGIKADSYALLAERLAGWGIASVRYDKRGVGGSAAALQDEASLTIQDLAADAITWVERTNALTDAACVWLIGHSQGGLLALMVAPNRPDICGLILVAAPGRPFGEVLMAQLRANPANATLLAPAQKAVDALSAGQTVDPTSLPKPLQSLFRSSVQTFLKSLVDIDPAKLLSAYSGPVMVLQGTADLQVPVADAQRLEAARPDVTLRLLPNVNHVLKTVPPDDRAANLATYGNLDLPLAPGVAQSMSAFVRSNLTSDQ